MTGKVQPITGRSCKSCREVAKSCCKLINRLTLVSAGVAAFARTLAVASSAATAAATICISICCSSIATVASSVRSTCVAGAGVLDAFLHGNEHMPLRGQYRAFLQSGPSTLQVSDNRLVSNRRPEPGYRADKAKTVETRCQYGVTCDSWQMRQIHTALHLLVRLDALPTRSPASTDVARIDESDAEESEQNESS